MIAFNSKFPGAETTIFTVMTELAQQLNALNLSQGFPDFDPPHALLEAFAQLAADKHQYAAGNGIIELRQLIASQYQQLHQHAFDPVHEVTITAGATIAIFSIIQAFIHPKDEVIIFDPSYDSYGPAVKLAGGTAVHLALTAPSFAVDWQAFADALTDNTRMVIVNTPHNPTGTVWSKQDWLQLIALTQQRNILILSDEVYEFLIFDGQPHYSVMDFPELRQRAFAVGSFGKSLHVTGWRTGYCVAPASLMREMRQVYQFANFCAVHPCQLALSQFLQTHPEHLQGLATFYQDKRDQFVHGLAATRFQVQASQGTYFQMVDYSAIRPDLADTDFCQWLAQTHKIVAIPISVFYHQLPNTPPMRLIRFCFAKQTETLTQAIEILKHC